MLLLSHGSLFLLELELSLLKILFVLKTFKISCKFVCLNVQVSVCMFSYTLHIFGPHEENSL